jgi:hypothetical protein
VKVPVVPVRVYVEARYQNLSGEDAPDFTSIYAGANLVLR